MKNPKTLLVDGDIVAYKCSAAVETEVNWGGGIWTLYSREEDAQEKAAAFLADLQEKSGADELVVFLTGGRNFRFDVWPDYKGHRKDVRKPLCLKPLRKWMEITYDGILTDGIEADDAIGIVATSGEEGLAIWSEDKDLKTIPATHFSLKDGYTTITEDEANRFFFKQVLTGDQADGYGGCPSVGEVTAKKLLGSETDPKKLWQIVVKAYEKQGFGEEYALTMARLARILRTSDWDEDRSEPILWTPPI